MCGRLALHHLEAVRVLADLLSIPLDLVDLDGIQERYNTLPTHLLPVIWDTEDGRVLRPMQWGWLKRGSTSARHINARSETVFELPTFREAASAQRCVVVVNGYYEWERDHQDRPLEPHYIYPGLLPWLTIAGIYQQHNEHKECALLTMGPNIKMAAIHDRMPCMLDPVGIDAWLSSDRPRQVIQDLAVPEDYLNEHVVSDRVNQTRNEGPDLILPAPPPPRQVDWLSF